MSATGKSHHERFETNVHRANCKNLDQHLAIVTNEDAIAAAAMNSAKDSAATIHESRIRAAIPPAIGTAVGLPDDSTLGNPVFAMAKSLVMKDSALGPPKSARKSPRAKIARAKTAGG